MDDRQILDLLPSETPLRKINRRSATRETGFVASRLRHRGCLDHESHGEPGDFYEQRAIGGPVTEEPVPEALLIETSVTAGE